MRHKNHETDFHHLLWRTGCPCRGHCDCVTLSKLSPPRPHASHQWTGGGWLHTGDWGLRDIPVGPGTERVLSESPSLFPRYLFFSDWQSCCSCAKTGCSAFGRLRVTCSQSWGCAGCRGLRALTCMAKRKPKGQVLTQVGRLVPWALLTSLPFSQEGKGHYFPVLRCRSLRGERLGRVYEIPREGQDLPVSSCSLPATSQPWLPWPPTNQAVCSITYQQYINYTL